MAFQEYFVDRGITEEIVDSFIVLKDPTKHVEYKFEYENTGTQLVNRTTLFLMTGAVVDQTLVMSLVEIRDLTLSNNNLLISKIFTKVRSYLSSP